MQLVLATRNKDKIKEIKNILEDLPITILTFGDFIDFPEVEETGRTLDENAILKAKMIAQFTGYPALADDSGLEVDYLDGAPGVYSSRYAGMGCTYDDNNKKLLKMLEGVPERKRSAKFRTAIAIAWNGERVEVVEGIVEGIILENSSGNSGFGYDPIFFYPAAQKTFAEMTLKEKNQISHRGKALLGARNILVEYLKRR